MGVWQLIVIEAINDMELLIALSIGMMGALYGFIKLLRYKQINSFIALGDPLILAVLIPEVTASIVPVYMYIRDWMYRPDDFIYSYILSFDAHALPGASFLCPWLTSCHFPGSFCPFPMFSPSKH